MNPYLGFVEVWEERAVLQGPGVAGAGAVVERGAQVEACCRGRSRPGSSKLWSEARRHSPFATLSSPPTWGPLLPSPIPQTYLPCNVSFTFLESSVPSSHRNNHSLGLHSSVCGGKRKGNKPIQTKVVLMCWGCRESGRENECEMPSRAPGT